MKQSSSLGGTPRHSPVEAARVAIWRLFEEGYVDEDMATAGLLAVDLGTRRAQRRPQSVVGQAHSSSADRRVPAFDRRATSPSTSTSTSTSGVPSASADCRVAR